MKEFWDERYGNPDYVYGEQPNEYLREKLPGFSMGKILFPADGEGRNGVYAAVLGWEVSAFDLSIEGQKKALALAEKNGVKIDYRVGEFQTLHYNEEQFDAIALIYAHFSTETKSAYHKILETYLATGGIIIFEAFSKRHVKYQLINKNAGGPKDIDMLFSKEEIASDFAHCDVIELIETDVELEEGRYHKGKGSVIRFVGRKR